MNRINNVTKNTDFCGGSLKPFDSSNNTFLTSYNNYLPVAPLSNTMPLIHNIIHLLHYYKIYLSQLVNYFIIPYQYQ